MKLNTILYGPPGTGKTYNTINKAIEIIEDRKVEKNENRIELKKKFEEYQNKGQIVFVTFHQSYGYEEFVEGIKAQLNDADDVIYKINDGAFKKISKRASDNINNSISKELKKSEKFDVLWNKLQKLIIDELDQNQKYMLTENVYIFEVEENKFKYKGDNWTHHYQGLNIKYENIKKLYLENVKERRDVKNISDIESLAKQHATYNIAVLNKIYNLEENATFKSNVEELKKYILIIDEINRGNISKIFGELITLIEDSKRAGNDEEVELILPYSNQSFSVPNNLYILGTMNTADRSIALMDTALRRRFHFEEMMPNLELLNDLENMTISSREEGIAGDTINVKELLNKINLRIEYLYDRDHTIGHAYFLSLKDKKTEDARFKELGNIFRNKIIPLLQEYFYDDWEKIQIVLGDHPKQFKKKNMNKNYDYFQFIKSTELNESDILGLNHDDIEDNSIDYKINSYFSVGTHSIWPPHAFTLGHLTHNDLAS